MSTTTAPASLGRTIVGFLKSGESDLTLDILGEVVTFHRSGDVVTLSTDRAAAVARADWVSIVNLLGVSSITAVRFV